MADAKMIPIGADLDLNKLVNQIQQMYQGKGFEVTVAQMGQQITINFNKDADGIKKFVGLALAITANITINNNTMMINFTDAEWTGKIIALAVGWILCFVPFALGIYGAVKQSELPKIIGKDIQMLIASGSPM